MAGPFSENNIVAPPQDGPSAPPATVTVGVVDFGDDNQAKYTDQDSQGVYADYIVNNRYLDEPNVFMGGVTSPNGFQGASVSFVQLAAPTLAWECDWTACKVGDKPRIPDEVSKNPDWVFLRKTPETAMVTVAADGVSPLYRISGTYYYGHVDPQAATTWDRMSFPRPPWLLDVDSRTVDKNLLQKNISESGSGSGGSGLDQPAIASLETAED